MPILQDPAATIRPMTGPIDPESLTEAELEQLYRVHFEDGYDVRDGVMGTMLRGRWVDSSEVVEMLAERGFAGDLGLELTIEIDGDCLMAIGSRAFTGEGAAVVGEGGRVSIIASPEVFGRILARFDRHPGNTPKLRRAIAATSAVIRAALDQ